MADDTADDALEESPPEAPEETAAAAPAGASDEPPAAVAESPEPTADPPEPAAPAEPAAESPELADLSAQLDAVLAEPPEAAAEAEVEGDAEQAARLLDQVAIDALLSASGRVPSSAEAPGRGGLVATTTRSAAMSSQKIGDLDLLADVVLLISAEIGRTEMTIDEVLKIRPGTLIELDKLAGEPVELFVGDRCIARGEVVVVDDSFGVRITELGPPE